MSDEVGSVGEEAAKLFSALQDWAQETGPAAGSGLGAQLGEHLRTANEHVATGGEDCTLCPVCQVIHKVRGASPEVRTHLAVAASSVLQAAAALLEARAPRPDAHSDGVQRIDLDDETGS